MKSKKGFTMTETLIGAIIAILVFVAIWAFLWGPLKSAATGATGESICTSSVNARDKIGWANILNTIPLNCDTTYYCFKKAGGECPTAQKAFESTFTIDDASKIQSKIAEIMRTCWRQLGEGRKKFQYGSFCGVCSVLFFDTKLESENIDIMDYLANKVMSGENPNKMTYKQYFELGGTLETALLEVNTLNPNQPYSITYSVAGNITLGLKPSKDAEGCTYLESI